MILTEYNPKKQRQMDIRDAREEGLALGRTEGLALGRTEGHKTGFREGSIQTLIQDNIEEGIPKERTIAKLQKKFLLNREEAEQYYESIKHPL